MKTVDPHCHALATEWMDSNRAAVAPRDLEDTITMLAEDIQTVCEEMVDEDYADCNVRALERWRGRRDQRKLDAAFRR